MKDRPSPELELRRNAPIEPKKLQALFDAAWPNHGDPGWKRVLACSLGWVTAHRSEDLMGFVNIATDGGAHAFLLDVVVLPEARREGIGRQLVREAKALAREAGATWLHVDFERQYTAFYTACGFQPTAAGLLRLTDSATA